MAMNGEMMARAYERIGDRTPLRTDCGRICGAACCRPDQDGQGGVYLFPGEEGLNPEWGRIQSDVFGRMLLCDSMCVRERRPLACRIFPLTPVKDGKGRWTVRMDVRARPVCPLARSGVRGLDPEFVEAVRQAIRVVAEAPEGEAFLGKWQALEEQYRTPLW
ncbi:MAG: hypothetical protein U0L09_07180 [Christensenellales bacterium]|nr:hypothetical protein [Christensenellales bacterium]